MSEISREEWLNERLEILAQAEIEKQAGRVPSNPTLALSSLGDIQKELTDVATELAVIVDGSETSAETARDLAEAVRQEVKLALSPNKPRHYVVNREKEISGTLCSRAYVAFVFMGVFLIAATAAILTQHWMVLPVPLGGALLSLLYSRIGVRQLRIESKGKILVYRGRDWEELDLTKYSHIRSVHSMAAEHALSIPSVIIFQTYPIFPVLTGLLGRLFPSNNEKRMVLFFNTWRNDAGYLVSAGALDRFFKKACEKAGHQIDSIDQVELTRARGWIGTRTSSESSRMLP